MPTAQGSSSIREAVESAFLSNFKFNEFGCKPCDPPFSYSEPSWMEQMKAMTRTLGNAGLPVANINIATAARLTHKVTVKDGIQALAKMISDEVEKSKPKPKTRSIWNWIMGRDSPA